MNCERFLASRAARAPHDADSLEHLRSCASCLEAAVETEPDDLFRSLGGDDLVPAGGVDLFVAEVMRDVEVRIKEKQLTGPRRVAPVYRWAAAAALAVGLITASLHRIEPARTMSATSRPPSRAAVVATVQPVISRPVVENYESSDATIVEMPSDKSDVAVVMIFDQKLPADL